MKDSGSKKTYIVPVMLALLVSWGLLLMTPIAALAAAKDDPLLTMVLIDQLELLEGDGESPLVVEAQGWIGHDLRKLWIKTDLERVNGDIEEAELQALYSQAISTYWDLQLGLRKDFKPTPDRSWAVIGLQGLAPYSFEVDAALFVGESGRTALRLNAEYELLLTQRVILTPEIEFNIHGQNDEVIGTGSGLSDVVVGLRLRYEIRRKFAPYIGVNWSKKFGNTAEFARDDGAKIDDLQWVIGVRAWF